MASNSTITSGSLVPRVYGDFRGVDFTGKEVALTRSPDALNMWKDYKKIGKCVETRPSLELYKDFTTPIYGIHHYKVGSSEMNIIHSGSKLYLYKNNTLTELFTGMNTAKSISFVYNNILYIKDGINYLRYNGQTLSEVVGFVPTTTIAKKPQGSGTSYQAVNLLSPYAYNTFIGDGESKVYQLDVESFDNETPVVSIDGEDLTPLVDYTWDRTKGTITFTTAPEEPSTTGQANVSIKYKKTEEGYADRIKKCTLLTIFDNRVFFSGNTTYPNTMFWAALDDPTYVPSTNYTNEGLNQAAVKGMVAGNNALWVFKEPSQEGDSIYYHIPYDATDDNGTTYRTYSNSNSNISTGAKGEAINFNDDIVFFSDRGMEGISSDVTTEQVIKHRSTLVDSKLLSETNYEKMILQEWEGYLLIIIDKKVYLADSRAAVGVDTHNEYEWFYWELEKNITCASVINGVLYLGATDGIYTLTNISNNREINSYWTTPLDEFKVGEYQKTTNKRGCVIDMEGETLKVETKTDNNSFEEIGTYTNTKGYVVSRIKKKKWKAIQMKLSSNKPIGLYSINLQAFVGAYVKR